MQQLCSCNNPLSLGRIHSTARAVPGDSQERASPTHWGDASCSQKIYMQEKRIFPMVGEAAATHLMARMHKAGFTCFGHLWRSLPQRWAIKTRLNSNSRVVVQLM